MPVAAMEYLGFLRVIVYRTHSSSSAQLHVRAVACRAAKMLQDRCHALRALHPVCMSADWSLASYAAGVLLQVRIIEELALLNGSTFFSLVGQLGAQLHAAGDPRPSKLQN